MMRANRGGARLSWWLILAGGAGACGPGATTNPHDAGSGGTDASADAGADGTVVPSDGAPSDAASASDARDAGAARDGTAIDTGTAEDTGAGDTDAGTVEDTGPSFTPGTHFGAPAQFDIPVRNETGTRFGFSELVANASPWFWTTMDMNGDGKPDLVETSDDTRTGGQYVWGIRNGTPYWKVYLNTGTGLSTTPVQWTVPTRNESGTPDTNYGYSIPSASSSPWFWTTMDMNGDGKPDLVETSDDTRTGGQYVWGIRTGTPYWRVYLNTGTGFSTTPVQWTVPARNEGVAANVAYGYSVPAISAAPWSWLTLDVDGDGKPDLVETSDDTRPGHWYVWGIQSGTPYWRVYRNTGNGFDTTPVQWTVPARNESGSPATDFGFSIPSASSPPWNWLLMDLNGDHRVDFVETSDDTRTGHWYVWGIQSGAPYWKAYLNTGTGFDATATPFPVPPRRETNTPSADYGYAVQSADSSPWFWTEMDMDGDGRLDFVETSDDTRTGGQYVWGIQSGTPYWRVYRNDGSSFASTPIQWAVPARHETGTPSTNYGFSVPVLDNRSNWIWYTLDLNGDGIMDFVQTADDASGGGFVYGVNTATPYWQAYFGAP